MDEKEVKKIVSEIKKEIAIVNSVVPRTVSRWLNKIEEKGPFLEIVRVGILAHQKGVNIQKFITDEEILKNIREGQEYIRGMESEKPKIIYKEVNKYKTIKIGDDFKLTDPILANDKINEAKFMTKFYAKIYVYENSIREVINLVLKNAYGDDWWNSCHQHHKLKGKVEGRKQNEGENAWHSVRNAHAIYYLDFKDLKSIISSYWGDFENIFPSKNWIESRIEEMSFSRNIIAHNNPLKLDDIKRMDVYINDWNKQIKSIRDKL